MVSAKPSLSCSLSGPLPSPRGAGITGHLLYVWVSGPYTRRAHLPQPDNANRFLARFGKRIRACDSVRGGQIREIRPIAESTILTRRRVRPGTSGERTPHG